jgi:hypothetical protein
MTTVRRRQELRALIDAMSGTQLRVASEFLAFVSSRKIDAVTRELLTLPGFGESLARGVNDIKAGRTKPWHPVGTRSLSATSGDAV